MSCTPLARMIEDCLARALLNYEQIAQGYSVRIDTSVELLGAGVKIAQSLASLLNSGAVSVNEARQRIGLASVALRDTLRSPTNPWPLEAWSQAVLRSSDTTHGTSPSG